MQVSLITFFISGIAFSALAIPLIRKKIKINNWYGIRIPQTLDDEDVWYEVNALMGKYIFSWGIFISVLTIYFFLNPTDPEYLMIYILLVILISGAILLVIVSYKVSNNITLRKRSEKEENYE
ncbi:MAG: SdpI family protein [Melioribacteraceae bacterium]|nr:SdpI family protein [Melioribacteraceae bacterium]